MKIGQKQGANLNFSDKIPVFVQKYIFYLKSQIITLKFEFPTPEN
jgi:hypothetical protein